MIAVPDAEDEHVDPFPLPPVLVASGIGKSFAEAAKHPEVDLVITDGCELGLVPGRLTAAPRSWLLERGFLELDLMVACLHSSSFF
jgi:hypothetical protein